MTFDLIGVAGDVVGGGYGAHSGLGNVDHAPNLLTDISQNYLDQKLE
ncbi:hypothetical protein [Nonomuraea angiospora]|nr:hypothetical protein [Nonomuraea angiospora]MDX3110307.1 hypothetical protein [Nonomuraea angiospora]